MSIVKLEKVSFSYKDKKILNNITFDIKRGETFGLVGNSGSGKSTIGLLLLKLLTDYSGTIEIDEKDISSIKRKADIKDFYKTQIAH